MKKKIHIPDYKQAGIGFTMIPTCVLEAPEKWGLSKNAMILYVHLACRIKKEAFFNGKVLKFRMKGVMGETAVANSLKELCRLGFCKKRPYRSKDGKLAGWDYLFFAIPKDRQIVESVDPKLAGKLDKINWFDDDLSSFRGAPSPEPGSDKPHPGIGDSGNTPFNSKEEIGKETVGKEGTKEKNETDKSPLPLSEKEGDFSFDSSGEVEENKDPDSSPGNEDPDFQKQKGRWAREMNKILAGKYLLDSLHPGQIPDDKALRRPVNFLKTGTLPPAYVAFLIEKIVVPNRVSHEKRGTPLYTIAEIIEFQKNPDSSIKSDTFKTWRSSKIHSLNHEWKRLNEQPCAPDSIDELAESQASKYRYAHFTRVDDAEDDSHSNWSSPFEYLIFLRLNESPGSISRALLHPPIWMHLLKEAAFNHKEFFSLMRLVDYFSPDLPDSHTSDLNDLRDNWLERHKACREEIENGFERLGSRAPAINI